MINYEPTDDHLYLKSGARRFAHRSLKSWLIIMLWLGNRN